MATGKRVAVIDCGVLAGLFGQSVEVRRSQVDGKKYPLYLSTPAGPVPLNTAKAQNFILENARFDGAPVPDAANDDLAPDPVVPDAANDDLAPDPVVPDAANDYLAPDPVVPKAVPAKKAGGSVLGWLGDFD